MDTPRLIRFRNVPDNRGDLTFTDFESEIPFDVKRTYWIASIPENQQRGGHAHKTGMQLIICIAGNAQIVLESPEGYVKTFKLDTQNEGLLIPQMWWGEMTFNNGAMLLGFASDRFNEEDYIRNKANFK